MSQTSSEAVAGGVITCMPPARTITTTDPELDDPKFDERPLLYSNEIDIAGLIYSLSLQATA